MRQRSRGSSARTRLVALPMVALFSSALVALSASSAAAASTIAGANAEGTGPQPKGLGLGSKAALAQPTCTENGHTSFVYVGAGPFCVNPWPEGKGNGGATAPGVTATDVKVVFYGPNQEMADAQAAAGGQSATNRTTGGRATLGDVVRDFDAVYQYAIRTYGTWQTWGRKPVYEFVTATGPDEAAQRADALEVIDKKPFIVIDAGNVVSGSPVFAATIAAREIIVASPATNAENAARQRPFRWVPGQDPDAAAYLTASFVGRSLSGEKAKWAGDSSMTSKTRSFGAVYPASGLDIDAFKRLLRQNGGSKLIDAVEYNNIDPSKFEEAAPTLATRLKNANVTSVVLFAEPPMVRVLMAAATKQEYRPEWIITGFLFHDFDGFARGFDQEQMAHAFGIGVLPPSYEGSESSTGIFEWYWGPGQGSYAAATQGAMSFIYSALQYAGPALAPNNVEKGLFSVPGIGGASSGTTNFRSGYGKTVGLPYNEYALLGTDRNLAWWNPDITGPANAVAALVGKGKFVYLSGAKRYGYGQFPKKQPKFFDESVSVAEVPLSSSFRDGVLPAANPCTGCPVNGGTGAA